LRVLRVHTRFRIDFEPERRVGDINERC